MRLREKMDSGSEIEGRERIQIIVSVGYNIRHTRHSINFFRKLLKAKEWAKVIVVDRVDGACFNVACIKKCPHPYNNV